MYMANQSHIYTPSASTASASTVTITGNPPLTNAITINGMSANTLSYYDGFDGKGSIKIGGQELDGDRLRKLDALLSALDSLEDDNAIKELYNIQLMLNKIKGRK